MDNNTIKINYVLNTVYQLLSIVIPLITAPYISRKLGVENVGYFSNVMSIISYFTLFANLGIYTYGRREVGALQKDKPAYSQVFWDIFYIRMIIGGVSLAAFFAFVLLVPRFKVLYLFASFTLLAQIFDISWLFQGLEDYKVTVLYQSFVKIGGAVAIFIFVNEPNDLGKYIFILSFLSFAGVISVYPLLGKYVEKPKNKVNDIKKHFIAIFILFIPQIATSLYLSVDKTMLGYYYKDGIQGGLYEQASKIYIIGLHIVMALTGVMIPRISLYYKEHNEYELKKSTDLAIKYIMFAGCPLAFGISGIGYNVLPWFFGPGYEGSCLILYISSFLILIMGLTNYLGYGYLVATRQQKRYTILVFLGLIINILFNLLYIPTIGGVGAALASVISEGVVLAIEIIILGRQLDLKKSFGGTLRYFCSAFFMGTVVLVLSKKLKASIICSIIIGFVGIATYSIPLIVLKDAFIIKIVGEIKRIINRIMK